MLKNNEHHNDVWYQQAKVAITRIDKPSTFVGQCCELKMAIENHATKNKISCPNEKHDGLLYDGYLHFPELEILISRSIIQFVDIHGLGKEDNTDVPGLLHGVVNEVSVTVCCCSLYTIPNNGWSVER